MKHAKQHAPSCDQWVPNATSLPIGHFDLERMKEALASPSIMAPRGMSKEEICRFIISGGRSK